MYALGKQGWLAGWLAYPTYYHCRYRSYLPDGECDSAHMSMSMSMSFEHEKAKD